MTIHGWKCKRVGDMIEAARPIRKLYLDADLKPIKKDGSKWSSASPHLPPHAIKGIRDAVEARQL